MGAYFISNRCTGCTLCAKSCPVHAISGEAKQRHVIDPERCIGCGLCGRLCSFTAILNDKGAPAVKQPKAEWKHPLVFEESCVGCSVCVENCPKNCLSLSDPAFQGDTHTVAKLVRPADCIGCGICASVCPIGIIDMRRSGDLSLHSEEEKKYKESHAMYKIYCRVFQACLKLGNYFMGYRMPEYIEGPGCITRLPEMVLASGADNVLLVTGPNITKRGLNKSLMDALDEKGVKYTVFNDIAANPTSDAVEAGLAVYNENGCNAIIAFGGGSPMDCAKAIAARVVRPKKSVKQLQGLLKVMKKIPPFFAVPTTAGTGSETTVAAVITDSATHRKASINDPNLLPKYAVLDPELTLGLPPKTTGTTGLDALCHAVEAYTNHTYNTKLENRLARDAVKLIYDNLLKAYQDGSDIEARQNMQKAAFFAGRAFTRGCVGYVHAVGHTVSGLYGFAHGEAMAIILPHVMRQFGSKVYKRLAELADVCGIEGANKKEKAENFIRWMEQLKAFMDLPVGINFIEVKDIPQMIAWAMKEANPLYPVPVIWGEKDFRVLIETLRTAK